MLKKLNYTPDCTVLSLNSQNFLGKGSPSPFPRSLSHSISGFTFDSGFDLKSRVLCALGLGFTLISAPVCLIISLKKGNYRYNFSPLFLNFLSKPLCFMTRYTDCHMLLGSLSGLGPPNISDKSAPMKVGADVINLHFGKNIIRMEIWG